MTMMLVMKNDDDDSNDDYEQLEEVTSLSRKHRLVLRAKWGVGWDDNDDDDDDGDDDDVDDDDDDIDDIDEAGLNQILNSKLI